MAGCPRSGCTSADTRAVTIFDELETWLHAQLPKIPGKSELAKAIH